MGIKFKKPTTYLRAYSPRYIYIFSFFQNFFFFFFFFFFQPNTTNQSEFGQVKKGIDIMKTYEETRKAIGKALDNYSTNTHAIAQMMLDVLTRDLTCSQFDKFFEFLMDKVLHYHDHRHFEEMIEKAGFRVNICPSYTSTETSPNSDKINKERYKSSQYDENLERFSITLNELLTPVDFEDECEVAKVMSDISDKIMDNLSQYIAIELSKTLLTLNEDSVDCDDISDITHILQFNCDCVKPVGIAIRDFIMDTSQADMKANLHYISRIIATHTNIENYALFYAIVQKELTSRLYKEGENTDVF